MEEVGICQCRWTHFSWLISVGLPAWWKCRKVEAVVKADLGEPSWRRVGEWETVEDEEGRMNGVAC